MAKTPAEIQKAYRERKKEREAQASVQLADVFKVPFCSYVEDKLGETGYVQALELVGIKFPDFEDDRGLAQFPRSDTADPLVVSLLGAASNSLGRAELTVDCLAVAAQNLAGWVSGYKKREIKQRLLEIEERDLSDPEAKRAAMQEATRLNKMLDQLDKQVRITLPQWKVTG